jgi:hypothetical protein
MFYEDRIVTYVDTFQVVLVGLEFGNVDFCREGENREPRRLSALRYDASPDRTWAIVMRGFPY